MYRLILFLQLELFLRWQIKLITNCKHGRYNIKVQYKRSVHQQMEGNFIQVTNAEC